MWVAYASIVFCNKFCALFIVLGICGNFEKESKLSNMLEKEKVYGSVALASTILVSTIERL